MSSSTGIIAERAIEYDVAADKTPDPAVSESLIAASANGIELKERMKTSCKMKSADIIDSYTRVSAQAITMLQRSEVVILAFLLQTYPQSFRSIVLPILPCVVLRESP